MHEHPPPPSERCFSTSGPHRSCLPLTTVLRVSLRSCHL
ncbi:rCG32357 [Rattus norvegicus]|uniref:RCG32357 n=1 Tax=Rattus norvegicus TaxID=10116 RepID=A6JXJ2_RAT|nr:rCG32357 [Rattus norvegicus]